MRVIATIAALALFGGLLWYGLRQQARVECDVCVTFKGRTECRVGRGDTEESAIASANTAACAVLGSGVTDAMQCSVTRPTSATCRQL
ncbi:MAG: hypothetical protein V3V67_17935 [Myxococcota bacterium]